MKSIRAKINLSLVTIASGTFVFSSFAYDAARAFSRQQDQLQQSLALRSTVQELEALKVAPLTDPAKTLGPLKKFRQSISREDRQLAISNLLQALNTVNKELRTRRFQELHASEARFVTELAPQLRTSQEHLKSSLLWALLFPLAGLLWFSVYLNGSIVVPLQRLSQRMMDFLVDRYTFKLATPENNEIGDLQRTFNSLAQRSINNVEELKALDRPKSEFVSIASHELRTPLTSIKGSLGILSSGIVGDLDPEALGLIRIAEQETDRLVRLINNLLDLAKMESRTFKLQKEWVPVQRLAESSLEALIGLAQTAQVRLEIQRPPEALEASFDQDRVQQIITNLMSNAIKYSPKNQSVVLSYHVNEEKQLEIGITDRGPGIEPEDQELIFEKFRQATQPESKLVKGTGLGLAISKALVEEHGGYIGVRSQPQLGSTFYFTLPEWRLATEPVVAEKWSRAA